MSLASNRKRKESSTDDDTTDSDKLVKKARINRDDNKKKPNTLHCPHCSQTFYTKGTLTRHLNSNKKCLRTRGILISPYAGRKGYCKICGSRACFGVRDNEPVHCAQHRLANEQDVVNRKCAVSGCTTQPSFGTEEGKPVHCAQHRMENEQDVVHRTCAVSGCTTSCSFSILCWAQ